MLPSRTLTAGAFCLLLAGCAAGSKAPVPPLPQDFTLELPQSGGRFVLFQGEEVHIRLPANRSTGYSWSMIAETPSGDEALHLMEEPAYSAEDGLPGRDGSEVWHFRAEATGPAMLYFTYRLPQDKDGLPARTATYNFEIR